jgi:hypothetical protein
MTGTNETQHLPPQHHFLESTQKWEKREWQKTNNQCHTHTGRALMTRTKGGPLLDKGSVPSVLGEDGPAIADTTTSVAGEDDIT